LSETWIDLRKGIRHTAHGARVRNVELSFFALSPLPWAVRHVDGARKIYQLLDVLGHEIKIQTTNIQRYAGFIVDLKPIIIFSIFVGVCAAVTG